MAMDTVTQDSIDTRWSTMAMSMTAEEPVKTDLANNTNIVILWPFVRPLVSYAILNIFLLVNDFALCCFISLFGVFTNILSIIVFCKMGFSEISNLNFLALSVFDFMVSLVTFLSRTLFSPIMRGHSEVAMIMHVSTAISLSMIVFQCGSAVITALISTERCVCVVFPLKVKTLLTRRRSLYMILIVAVYHATFLILLYADTGPPYNDYPKKLAFYFFSLYAVPTMACFFIVVFTTMFLVVKLRSNQRWRQETTTQSDKTSDKENKLVRTIIAISVLFIVCSFPNVGILITQTIYPRFNHMDPYLGTLITMMFTFSGVFTALSSSVNTFFYYKMSSKFNKVFHETFSIRTKEKVDHK